MSDNRPKSRKRGETTSSGDVYKRDEALNTGKVGNADYSGRKTPGHGPALNNKASGKGRTSRGITRAGGGLGLAAILALLLFGGNAFGGGGSSPSPTQAPKPTPTPTPTPVVTPAAASAGHYNPPVTTYTNTNMSDVSTTTDGKAREKFTKLKGNGQDTVTILVYMCATDLEANYGMATADINEMAYATQSDKVNVILQTGGTKKWQNTVMNTATNERWKVSTKSLIALDRNVGRKQMTDPATLQEFIEWGVKEYPADRYMLILWDHGGGSIQGYGYDQIYPNATMTVDKIANVLKNTGVKFDVVGFDACLMANVETAVAVAPYADYLIASEETEPGTGWYYTNWLTMLANNSSTPTLQFGKQLVDDFIAKSSQRDKTSLSIVDLAEFDATVPSALTAFAKTITSSVQADGFRTILNARSSSKEFAQTTKIDQVDLVHFCENVNSKEARDLISAIKGCVKYNRIYNMTNASGLSIYFPYRATSKVSTAARLYDSLGMDSSYTDAIRSFATLEASGQVVTNNSSNSLFNMLGGAPASNGTQYVSSADILSLLMGGGGSSSGYGSLGNLLGGSYGVDTSSVDLFSQLISGRDHVQTDELILSEVDGQQVLRLSQDQWDLINGILLNVWADDGTGYIDLGLDNVFEFNDEGDLIVDYDGKWISIDDQVVSYYMTAEEFYDDDSYVIEGYVPASVTFTTEDGDTDSARVNFIIQFTDQDPDGVVLGAQKVYEEEVEGKGYIELREGDTIDFICDYYDYDGNWQNTYPLGKSLAFDGELNVGTIQIKDTDLLFSYQLNDIYDSKTYTPMCSYR